VLITGENYRARYIIFIFFIRRRKIARFSPLNKSLAKGRPWPLRALFACSGMRAAVAFPVFQINHMAFGHLS
jgi:hypothetical protein